MHILFFSDNFPPEVNAPANRTFDHCIEWVKAGEKVTVITGVPNFPKGVVFEGFRNRLWQSQMIAGIKVIRVWTFIAPNEGFTKRVFDHISFMLSSTLASLLVRNVDIIVGTSPQFFTVCAAYVSSLFKRVPWVFELRDIWPESLLVVGVMERNILFNTLEKMELFLYRKASAIVSVTHAFKSLLTARGVRGDKIYVVTNGVNATRFSPREKDSDLLKDLNLQNKFIVGYVGTHGLAHKLNTILDAAKILLSSSYDDRFRFLFAGDGADKASLCKRVQVENIDNVVFVESTSNENVCKILSLLDASVIHLKNDKLFSSVIPSKLFESMAMGIPVLHGVRGESLAIVESTKVGLFFEPENPRSLIESLQNLVADPILYNKLKTHGPIEVLKYDRTRLASDMLRILKLQCPDTQGTINYE